MLKLRVLVASCAILGFAADAFGQCVDQCGTLVVGNQNGIRMHRGLGVTATDFPNIATGNLAGDSLWKVYPCFVLSNGAGSMTLTGVELPLIAGNYLAPGTTNIPDIEFRPAIPGGGGCLEPDFAAATIAAFTIGNIALPNGNAFAINVTLPSTPIPNGDVAIVYLATAAETSAMNNYARAYRTTVETNPTPCGFSGSANATGPVVTGLAPTSEVRFEFACLEAALQAFSTEPAATVQRTGTGGYFPVAGTSVGWRCESFDGWNKGQQGLLVLSTSGGVCPGACTLPDPFGGAACASLVFDGMTVAGLQIPGVLGPFLLTPATPLCGAAGFAPFADGTRDTPAYPVPAGLSGFTLYSAFASLCLTPAPGASIVTEFSNTVRMSFQ